MYRTVEHISHSNHYACQIKILHDNNILMCSISINFPLRSKWKLFFLFYFDSCQFRIFNLSFLWNIHAFSFHFLLISFSNNLYYSYSRTELFVFIIAFLSSTFFSWLQLLLLLLNAISPISFCPPGSLNFYLSSVQNRLLRDSR